MADYERMYSVLCLAIDSSLDALEQFTTAQEICGQLEAALLEAEQIYIETCEEDGS